MPRTTEPAHPDRNAHLLNIRAIVAIQRSAAADFSGDGLAWGDWCRRLALAAMLGDKERVKELTVAGRLESPAAAA